MRLKRYKIQFSSVLLQKRVGFDLWYRAATTERDFASSWFYHLSVLWKLQRQHAEGRRVTLWLPGHHENIQTESALFFHTISLYILPFLWTQPTTVFAQEFNLSLRSSCPVVQAKTGWAANFTSCYCSVLPTSFLLLSIFLFSCAWFHHLWFYQTYKCQRGDF